MDTMIALFRGINVGGKSKLPMADLREILEGLGATDVNTYIQSGNAVFRYAGSETEGLADQIGLEVQIRYGFTPKVLLLSLTALKKAMEENPFREAETDPVGLHLGFLAEQPAKADLAKLESLRSGREQFRLTPSVFYLYAPDGVGRSKLAAGAEKALGVEMTDRNWRTVCTIAGMAEALKAGDK